MKKQQAFGGSARRRTAEVATLFFYKPTTRA